MTHKPISKLNPKKRYLQIALNSTLEEAHKIISHLPISDRIIIEAGTPLIKQYGENGIRQIREWYEQRLTEQILTPAVASANVSANSILSLLFQCIGAKNINYGQIKNSRKSVGPWLKPAQILLSAITLT